MHGDDQVREVDLTKAMTEETGPTMSHSKKKNKDLPSSQQKRKHQITYLAFRVSIHYVDQLPLVNTVYPQKVAYYHNDSGDRGTMG